MDTSETYIKMRVAARSDLLMGVPIECPCNLTVNDVWVDSKGDWYYSTEDESFQLERQDQLQEMVEGTHVEKLGRLYRATVAMVLYPSGSMEQLWLAFVMKEKYEKVWSGDSWISI